MTIKIIACINADGMLAGFRPPRDDLQRFAALTYDGTVIMGRKTWDTLPPQAKPLPHRRNLVVSRSPFPGEPGDPSEHALAWCLGKYPDAWVIGGGEIYAQTIPLARLVYLSQTEDTGGSVPFPLAAMNGFERLVNQQHASHKFSIWRRRA